MDTEGCCAVYRAKTSIELLARLAKTDGPCMCGATDYVCVPGDDGNMRNSCCGCH